MGQQLEVLEKEAQTLPQKAQGMIVENQVLYNNAASFIMDCKKLKKMIQDFFEPTIEGFKKAKAEAEKGRKAEVDRMNKFLEPVEEAEKIVMLKCKEYENEQFRKAEEERKKKEAAAETAKMLGDEEIAAKKEEEAKEVAPDINRATGLGIRRTWHWRIKDINQIPREYFVIDEVKINSVVRGLKGETQIPGIEVFFE